MMMMMIIIIIIMIIDIAPFPPMMFTIAHTQGYNMINADEQEISGIDMVPLIS